MTSTSALLSIIGVCFSLLANLISFPLLMMLFVRRRHKLAPLFLVNLCSWLFGVVLCSLYFLYIVFGWRGDCEFLFELLFPNKLIISIVKYRFFRLPILNDFNVLAWNSIFWRNGFPFN